MKPETNVLPPGRWQRLENGTWTGGVGWLQSQKGDVVLSFGIRLDREAFSQLGRGSIHSRGVPLETKSTVGQRSTPVVSTVVFLSCSHFNLLS